ncbi:DNA-directed RNA polymerase III subunit RPC6-like [Anneissia japonica]|uniref:DNA-directed RNA polymerase III subunit RPC6-like n=1 Tax=Anneissia japonica TaxID=1529436 RepID=UPI00142564EA|nr:DNA-directed RNA polymerase III subunit RPC6-like [Anneissia japonica]
MASSSTSIKQEPTDVMELEVRIMELCKQNANGVADSVIQKNLPDIGVQQRVSAINRLLSTGKIDLVKTSTELMYRAKDPTSSAKIKGADNQEKLVYQIIEESGNKGIWIRDIRYRSNILQTQVNKILKSLETRKLIKAVKSVGASKKKVYMLYNVQPDRSVTGGAWYSDQDFEAEFVDVLNQQCLKFLQQKNELAKKMKLEPLSVRMKSFSSSKEVWKYISELGISKVELSVEDIETILNTLIYDGRIEMTLMAGQGGSVDSGEVKLYRSVEMLIEPAGIMRVPCGVCPVFDQCNEGAIISPSNCVYMSEWLEF